MTTTRETLENSPAGVPLGAEQAADAIDACLRCVQACTTCADADLAEPDHAELGRCAALCTESADVSGLVARVLSRPAHADHFVVHRLLQVCIKTCTNCAEECARHEAHHRHCAVCAKTCRACDHACSELLDAEAFEELQKLAGG